MLELFFVHFDFLLTLLLTNAFPPKSQKIYYIYRHVNFYAYPQKLDSLIALPNLIKNGYSVADVRECYGCASSSHSICFSISYNFQEKMAKKICLHNYLWSKHPSHPFTPNGTPSIFHITEFYREARHIGTYAWVCNIIISYHISFTPYGAPAMPLP